MRVLRVVFELACILGLLFGCLLAYPFILAALTLSWLTGSRHRDVPHVRDPRGHYAHPEA